MGRVRSGDIEAGSIISRLIAPAAVLSRHIAKYAVTSSHIRPGSVDGSHLEAQAVRIKHLHPEMLPYPPVASFNSVTFFGQTEQQFDEDTGSTDALWAERVNSGTGSTWSYNSGTGELTVPPGTYLINANARFITNSGGTDVTVAWVINPWGAMVNETVQSGDDPEVHLSLAAAVYHGSDTGLYMNALVFTGGDPGYPVQKLRERVWTVIQLSAAVPEAI